MNCINHPDTAAVAFCRTCGKALCPACKRVGQGTIFCEEHAPAVPVDVGTAAAQPATPAVHALTGSPGLAFFLGFIPGVGAIYNGQYAKGLVHAVIFGLIVSVLDNGAAGMEPLLGIMLAAFIFYMAFEAYHTARKRREGEPVDEFSSLVNLRGAAGGFPIGAVALILLGILLLLNTTEILPLHRILRYWPALLILVGAYMLYVRLSGPNAGALPGERQYAERR